MATDLENAQARRTAILVELASYPAGLSDYSIDGQSEQRLAYRKSLLEELELLGKLMQQLDEGGAWAVVSYGKA